LLRLQIGFFGAEIAPQQLDRQPGAKLGWKLAADLDIGADDAELGAVRLGFAYRVTQGGPFGCRVVGRQGGSRRFARVSRRGDLASLPPGAYQLRRRLDVGEHFLPIEALR